MTTPTTRELAAIVVRLAEARVYLGRCQSRAAGARAARRLAPLVRDLEAFFASHGDAVPPELEAGLRRDMERVGQAILYLAVPAGHA